MMKEIVQLSELVYEDVSDTDHHQVVAGTFEEAVDFIHDHPPSEMDHLTFKLSSGWKSKEETAKFGAVIHNNEVGEQGVLRLLRRIAERGYKLKSPLLYYVLIKELGFICEYFTDIKRLHIRRIRKHDYDHLIATLRFAGKKMAMVEVAKGKGLTETCEMEYAGNGAIIYYRNETLPPYMCESHHSALLDSNVERKAEYSFSELKKVIQLSTNIFSALEDGRSVLSYSEVTK
jgi:hypothetical protein